jgi:hypothetical protein
VNKCKPLFGQVGVGLLAAIVATLFGTGAPALADSAQVAMTEEDLFVLPAPVAGKVELIDELTVQNHSGSPQTVHFSLPAGATSVTVNGTAVSKKMQAGNQVVLPHYVQSGKTKMLAVMWTLPLSSQQDVQFTLHTDYPIYTAHVYMPIGNSALSAEGLLTTTETVTVSGTQFREFTRLGINQGDDWTLSVQMLPSATAAPSTGGLKTIGSHPGSIGDTIEAVGNLLIVAVILGVGLLSIRATQWGRRGSRKTPEEALIDGLVTVHRQFELGMIDESEFITRKEQLKKKLFAVRGRA